MADFCETIASDLVRQRLSRAIQGKGAFRRFKVEFHPLLANGCGRPSVCLY